MILVTGGTGYIGSHTAVELLHAGYNVVLLDNLSNSNADVADRISTITGKKATLHVGDVSLPETFQEIEHLYGIPDAVIHFAAFKAVGESVDQPLRYFRNNIDGLITPLEKMLSWPSCKGIVFSSSCTVYGSPDHLPVSENSPILPAASPYGYTKQVCEGMLRAVCAASSLQAIALRYFNPIGAHPSALIGELPHGVPSNLMPFVTQSAIGKRGPLQVFGNDYDTPDGTCIRDFIHVVDLAKAHVAAVNRLLERKTSLGFEVFNVGTGKGFSVMEVIRTFERVTGVQVPFFVGPRRLGDVGQIWANSAQIEKELGWRASHNLEEMVRSAWEWEQSLQAM